MSTDIYLCANAPHAAVDIVLRTVAPCSVVAPDSGGSHSSGGVLGRRMPRQRPAKKTSNKPRFELPVVFDIEPENLVIATFGPNDLRDRRDIDALIACDAI